MRKKKIFKDRTDITFCYIKPDAVDFWVEIYHMIEQAGFRFRRQDHYQIKENQCKKLYSDLKEKDFFENLTKFTCSRPVIMMILEKENAVEDLRKLIGATNPADADPESIRGIFGTPNGGHLNAIHGSDSNENARKEAIMFFSRAYKLWE